MASTRHLLSLALRRSRASTHLARPRNYAPSRNFAPSHRPFATLNPKESPDDTPPRSPPQPQHTSSTKPNNVPTPTTADTSQPEEEKPGAIGGFMRGLMGGQSVAVEDAFIAEAKEQGVELPPPPPPRRADLVPVKRRKRTEDEEESQQTIRDRIFGRFAGSAFMRGAFDAKERIAERIDESDNPIINMFRNIYDRFFAENEMASVVREIREEDPAFRISEFLRHVEVELVPQILGAYLSGDRERLRSGCTEEAYAMLNASIRERDTEGVVMDTNILDVSDIELTAGKVLEDSPVLIVSFNTQQINCLRDKGGNVVEGSVDDIRAVYYAWALVREPDFEEMAPSGGGMGADQGPDSSGSDKGEKESEGESKENPDEGKGAAGGEAKPWKLMEMVIRGAHSTI